MRPGWLLWILSCVVVGSFVCRSGESSGVTLVRDVDDGECCVDGLIVHSRDWAAHFKVLDGLLQRLKRAHLVIGPADCVFGSMSVEFLKHSIGEHCISINEENLEKIRSTDMPTA